MKKLFALFIVVAILTLTATTVAAADEKTDTFDTYINLEYGYSYDSYVSAEGRTVNMYVKNTNAVSAGNVSCQAVAPLASVNGDTATQKIEATKSLLCNMGMDNEVVDSLTREELNDYADAESITTIIEYTKTDAEGNTVIIDERTANAEIQAIDHDQIIIGGDGGGEGDEDCSAYLQDYEDTYMRLSLTITDYGTETYSYTTAATWLTYPQIVGTDSLGICAAYNTPIVSSYSGWYSYRVSANNEEPIRKYFTSADFGTAINSSVGGAGVVFNLHDGPFSYFRICFSCKMSITHPTLETIFNVGTTYVHTEKVFSFTPSLSIDSYSIGISTTEVETKWNAIIEKPIHYIP